ncbi:diacylglycerol kinase family protein [Bacillus sp. 165]|uniref:diacylglycerol kinase family protein n=1 Tax=Bacillus sp. 165 TaxID=1529117 RepID=UPI001ADC5A79|nr:diacylglycerol kinase family protein [Bacillus sp. 165]MBO9129600.1 diacylglycerol kinase family protein [Bacillus sp. 165]
MKKGSIIMSFVYAVWGICYAIQHERNVQIHFWVTIIVTVCGLYLRITRIEWLIVLLTIGVVISLEMINTAIEKAVDVATEDIHPLAKIAKDVAAGAVLVFSIIAVIIGGVIFAPYLIQ